MKALNANSAAQITIKAVIIGGMILVMLIPVAMLISMIQERMEYQREVESEVGSTWGGPQTITGPILALPYETVSGEGDKQTTQAGTAYFLPETLRIDGNVDTEVRSRTAHEVLLYKSRISLEGLFGSPDVEKLGLKTEHIRWEEASVYVGISSLQGIQNRLELEWDGTSYSDAIPIYNHQLNGPGLSVKIPLGIPYNLKLLLGV